jgi:hypothetical protein
MTNGKLSLPSTSEEIAQTFLDDIELEALAIGISNPPVQPGTDWYILSRAVGPMGLFMYSTIAQSEENSSVLTATGTALDNIRIAYGLPVVDPNGSRGQIVPVIDGTRSLAGNETLTRNGLRYVVSGPQGPLIDGDPVDIEAVDTGEATNAEGGEEITFDNPPAGFSEVAEVSEAVPLRGGTDAETDERKRTRILNRLRFAPGGGNVGHIREIAFETLADLPQCVVYPALGGPGSFVAVPLKAIDPDRSDFSRVLDSEAGGDGTGWVDETPWPSLNGDTFVEVDAVTDSSNIQVSALDAAAPTAGLTHIVWFAPSDQTFYEFLVLATAGGAGVRTLQTDRPMVDSNDNQVAIGDYISPAAVNSVAYGTTFRDLMGTLGPGEATADANRLPRAIRQPKPSQESPTDINAKLLRGLLDTHDEIVDIDLSNATTATPTVPASVDTAPNVLVLDNFGIYPA